VSETSVRADRLSKRFRVPAGRQTALRRLRALASGDSAARERWVLRDLSFEVRKGEKLALVGENGSGKTTLLRLLTGIYRKTGGTLVVRGQPTALFSCEIGFIRDLSVLDNVYLFGAVYGIGRDVLSPREPDVLERAGVEDLAHAPLRDLSVGQVRRLALSIFSQTASDFLLFDEVVANLDHGFLRESEQFFGSLVRSDRTVIMTSHDASILRKYCDRALWLDQGRARRIGPVDDVIDEYERSFGPVGEARLARAR
jgi:ABC-type polysaccharide/polyol phosphate transport system ATPase subunit